MEKISVTKVPEIGHSIPGEQDLIIGWFPEPLLPIEERVLADRGALSSKIEGQKGYHIVRSHGIISYDHAQDIKQKALESIKQNHQERYLVFFSNKGEITSHYHKK